MLSKILRAVLGLRKSAPIHPERIERDWPDVKSPLGHMPNCLCKVCIPWRTYVRMQAVEGNPKAKTLLLSGGA